MTNAAKIYDSDGESTFERKRVVGLIRVSTAEQARDRGGIPRQRHVIEQTIRQKGLDCLRIYEISDVSGTEVLANPDIQEILQLVATGVVTGLVLADLDRLFRPTEPQDYAILQVFRDTGAVIYSGETEYRLDQKDSALFANIRSAISGFELQLMKERQQGAKEARRRQGKCPTPRITLPYGVSFDRKLQKWHYNENISKVIELFRLYDEEGVQNYCELGRRLGFFNVTVRNILRNPIYTGWRVISQKRGGKLVSKTGKTYRRKVDRKPDEVIRVRVIDTPVISQECFDRVQASIDRVRFNHLDRRKQEPVHNFGAGISRCARCGEILLCSSGKRLNRKRNAYYCCKANHYLYRKRLGGCQQPHLRQTDLDNLIEAFTVRTLTDTKTLTSIILGSLQRSNEIISPFPAANRSDQAESIKRREKRWLDAYDAGDISLDELRSRRETLRKEQERLKAQETRESRKSALDIEQLARLVVRGAARVKRISDRGEKKAIIHSLFDDVYVKGLSVTAFKLKSDLPVFENISREASKVPIQLETPFRIASEPEIISDGHKKCSCCGTVHPNDQYFPRKNQCKPCIKVKAHEAHLRRKSKRFIGQS